MNRLLVYALMLLFLPACATTTAKDDSPASDLDAMAAGMRETLRARTLPNGKVYCLELAATEDAQDDCAGDLEDAFFQAEKDKARGMTLFDKFVVRLKLQRNPCGFWSRLFNTRECKIK